jgi:hypothetical protein
MGLCCPPRYAITSPSSMSSLEDKYRDAYAASRLAAISLRMMRQTGCSASHWRCVILADAAEAFEHRRGWPMA